MHLSQKNRDDLCLLVCEESKRLLFFSDFSDINNRSIHCFSLSLLILNG